MWSLAPPTLSPPETPPVPNGALMSRYVTTSTTTQSPPSAKDVDRALNHLQISNAEPLQRLRQAIHLVTPRSQILDIQLRLDATTLLWRGADVGLTIPALSSLELLRSFVAAHTRPEDTFLDLDADPALWLKSTISGSRRLVSGVDTLFDGPRVSAELDVPEIAIPGIVREVLSRGNDPAGPTKTIEGTINIIGNRDGVLLRMDHHYPYPDLGDPDVHILLSAGRALAAELGGLFSDYVDLPSTIGNQRHVEYIIDLPNYQALISAYVDSEAAATFGYAGPWTPAKHPIDGWRTRGAALLEPGWVAVHEPSDITALLRLRPE